MGPKDIPELLEVRVGQALKTRGWTLAVGESCTGGLLSHRLNGEAGCFH